MNKLSPVPPSEHLKEFLEEMGVTAYRLAKETGMPQTRIGDIINKGRSITADTAMRLGRFFGTTAQFWMNLQTSYDLKLASIKHGDDYAKITAIAA
ncbi:MAG: addiction module antidote protein, HigA family [Proteobacteria bacterium]|nr:MAG: addiction module antidote protein, HigA family [Pseudomonadota bacterium]